MTNTPAYFRVAGVSQRFDTYKQAATWVKENAPHMRLVGEAKIAGYTAWHKRVPGQ